MIPLWIFFSFASASGAAKYTIGTNDLAALMAVQPFNIYEELRDSTAHPDLSHDGTGIRMETMSFHQSVDDYYRFYGLSNRTQKRDVNLSSFETAHQLVEGQGLVCNLAGKCATSNNPYWKLNEGQRDFMNNAYLNFVTHIAPGAWAVVAGKFGNVICNKVLNNYATQNTCTVIIAVIAYESGERVKPALQSQASYGLGYLQFHCPLTGADAVCLVTASGAKWVFEFDVEPGGSDPCPHSANGPTTCATHTCDGDCSY